MDTATIYANYNCTLFKIATYSLPVALKAMNDPDYLNQLVSMGIDAKTIRAINNQTGEIITAN